MKHFLLAFACSLALGTARQASADPINITSGLLDMHLAAGPLQIAGDRGFTFGSHVDVSGGVFNPHSQCFVGCMPGTNLNLFAFWTGNDVTGPATLDGVTYPNVGGLSSPSSMTVQFSGAAVLPSMTTMPVSVTAPFLFNGSFLHPLGSGTVTDGLVGFGVATIWLTPSRISPGSWALTEVRYDFGDVNATPEPGTLILLGTGLFAVAFLVRRGVRHPRAL
jgi:hypothetical protein